MNILQIGLDQLIQTTLSIVVILPITFLTRLTLRLRLALLAWAVIMSNIIDIDHFYNLRIMSFGLKWGVRTVFHSITGAMFVAIFSTLLLVYMYFMANDLLERLRKVLPRFGASSVLFYIVIFSQAVTELIVGEPKKLRNLRLPLFMYVGLAATFAHIAWDGPRKVLLYAPFQVNWVTISSTASMHILLLLLLISLWIFTVDWIGEIRQRFKTARAP